MQLLHEAGKTSAAFDDANLVSCAGLVPVLRLAEQCGLGKLVKDTPVRLAAKVGVNAHLKIVCLVAGMLAGADSIEDIDLLRHGALPRVFGGLRAPSTLGSFLRGFSHGNVAQLAAVHRRLLAHLAARARLLPRRGSARVPRHRLGAAAGARPQEAGSAIRSRQDRESVAAGARAQCSGGHRQYAGGRAAGVRGAAARWQRRLGAGRGQPARRSDPHGPRGRCHRAADRARGLGVLLGGIRGHVPPGRGLVLGHGEHESRDTQGDRHDSGGHLDGDQVSERGLRRGLRAVDL
jgi:hypothetical protein